MKDDGLTTQQIRKAARAVSQSRNLITESKELLAKGRRSADQYAAQADKVVAVPALSAFEGGQSHEKLRDIDQRIARQEKRIAKLSIEFDSHDLRDKAKAVLAEMILHRGLLLAEAERQPGPRSTSDDHGSVVQQGGATNASESNIPRVSGRNRTSR